MLMERQEPHQVFKMCIPIFGCMKVGLCSFLGRRQKNHQ